MRSTRPKGALSALVAAACTAVVVAGCVPPPSYAPEPTPHLPVLACDAFGDATLQPRPVPSLEGISGPIPNPSGACTGEGIESFGQLASVAFGFTGDLFARCDDPDAMPLKGDVSLVFDREDGNGDPYGLTAHLDMDPCRPVPHPNHPGPTSNQPEPSPCQLMPNPGAGPIADPFIPGEAVCMVGTITSGIYEGQPVSFTALVHPIPTEDLDGNGTIDIPTPNPNTPTMDSYLTWLGLADGPIPNPCIWSTDGAAFATLDGNDDAVLDGGFVVSPMPNPSG
ncbi:MAG TPA: hypothetical protein VJM33_07260 [Microthrixaceae bacterium]|nr:hypothetical protein [Microthrixaceae bacterium]